MHYNKYEWELYRNKSLHPKKIEEMDDHLLQCDKCFEIFESIFEENTETKIVIKKKKFKRAIIIIATLTIILTGFLQTNPGQQSLAAVAKVYESVKSSISEFFGEDYKEFTKEEDKLSLIRDDIKVKISETAVSENQLYFATYIQSYQFANADMIFLDYSVNLLPNDKNIGTISTSNLVSFDLKNNDDPSILEYNKGSGGLLVMLSSELSSKDIAEKLSVNFVINNIRILRDGKFTNLRGDTAYINNVNLRFTVDGSKSFSKTKNIPINDEFVFKDRKYNIENLKISPFNTNIFLSTGIDLMDDWRNDMKLLLEKNNIVVPELETQEIETQESYEEMLIHGIEKTFEIPKNIEEIYSEENERYMKKFIVEVFDENNKKYDFNQSLSEADLEKTYLKANLKNIKEFEELLKAKKLDIKIYEKIYNDNDFTRGGLLYSTSLNLK